MRKSQGLLATLLSRLGRKQHEVAKPAPVSKFQAIAIYRGLECCAMAKKFAEHRFLLRDAPVLPLPQCSMPERCECRYLRFKDRRTENRRADDFGAATRRYGSDRRARGRRKTD